MFDVIFITPSLKKDIQNESLGTLLLASILRDNGHSVKIMRYYDFFSSESSFIDAHNVASQILSFSPRIVSFYTRCDSYHIDIKIAEAIKKISPYIYVVFGGPQADITAVETISSFGCVDFVCCGEGERTIVPFVSSLITNNPNLAVEGLVYRNRNQIVSNSRPEYIQNLDLLPLIDFSFLGEDYLSNNGYNNRFPIDVGRGCPFDCTYCSTKTFWGRRFRLKSPERIVAEIDYVHKEYGVSFFVFNHDMFTMNRSLVLKTCQLIDKLPYRIHWRCSARLDCIDESLIDVMSSSGMDSIFLGIESGSNRMQGLLRKRLNLGVVLPRIRYLVDCNIKVITSFIYGIPGESDDDFSATLSLIFELLRYKNIVVQTHLCTFLPGTELSNSFVSEMRLADSFSDITGSIGVDDCMDIIIKYPRIFQHFYEFSSELRSRLVFFPIFIRFVQVVYPVYRYISEKYSNRPLIEMYNDFISCNSCLLENLQHLPRKDQIMLLLDKDIFIESFSSDSRYDMIRDYYRIKKAEFMLRSHSVEVVRDLYCISPLDVQSDHSLREYEYNSQFVISSIENGSIQHTIYK